MPVVQTNRRDESFKLAADPQHQPLKRLRGGQPGDHVAQMRQPCRRIELHHQRIRVTVDDEAGQTVIFAVYQPVTSRLLIDQRRAVDRGGVQALGEPALIDHRRLMMLQDSDANRGMGIVQPDG